MIALYISTNAKKGVAMTKEKQISNVTLEIDSNIEEITRKVEKVEKLLKEATSIIDDIASTGLNVVIKG